MTNHKLQDSYRYACSPWIQESSRSHATSLDYTQRSGFSLFATLQIRNSKEKMKNGSLHARKVIKNALNEPFRRISKVDKMILGHRHQIEGFSPEEQANKNDLKPKFKIKSVRVNDRKPHHLRYLSQLDCPTVKVKNFTMNPDPCESQTIQKEQEYMEEKSITSSNFFQQNFKNRCKLLGKHVKKVSPKSKGEASLLDRLNKLTSQTPLKRYKSRAFGSTATKVTPFFPSSRN